MERLVQGSGSWVTLAPALPGERAPTLGQTSQVWIPAEGPGHNLLVFLISKVKMPGPTSGDHGGTHAIGLANPWLWCSVTERSSFPCPFALKSGFTPPLPKGSQNSKCNIPSIGGTGSPLKNLLFLSNSASEHFRQPLHGWSPVLALLSSLYSKPENASTSPVPNNGLCLGPPMPSPSKPATLACPPPSLFPWL